MSGPIVRKYGFPNFENIFGKRELEHGVDEADAPPPEKAPQIPPPDDIPSPTEEPHKPIQTPKTD